LLEGCQSCSCFSCNSSLSAHLSQGCGPSLLANDCSSDSCCEKSSFGSCHVPLGIETVTEMDCCSAGGCSDSSAQCAHVVHNDSIYPSNHLLCNPGPSDHHCHSCSSIQFLEVGRVQDTHEHLLGHEGPALMRENCRLVSDLTTYP
jgi:hypothetical protein